MANKPKQDRPHSSLPARPKPNAVLEAVAEIDRLLRAREAGQMDDWQVSPRIKSVAQQAGRKPTFEAMINRLRDTRGQVRQSMFWALQLVGGDDAVAWLWEILRQPTKSFPARMSALSAIEQLAGGVDADDIPEDLAAKLYGGASTLRSTMQAIESAESCVQIEAALLSAHQLLYQEAKDDQPSGRKMLESVLEMLARRSPTSAGADLLRAVADTTPDAEIAQTAQRTLRQLAALRVEPTSPLVLALSTRKFYRALTTEPPESPELMQLTIAWKYSNGEVTALLFLIDRQTIPGLMQSVVLSRAMSELEFRRLFIEKPWLDGRPPRDNSLSEARQIVERALDVANRHHQDLPEEYANLRPLIEKRLLAAG